MKVIKVNKCEICPLKSFRYSVVAIGFVREYFCDHPSTEGVELKNLHIIHPDCPLEDYKKGE